MIKEDYISFEIAKLLKEKGFDGECNSYYDEFGLVCPTIEPKFANLEHYKRYSLNITMKWLREVHNLHIDVDPSEGDWNPTVLELENWTCAVKFGDDIQIQDSYEEAAEAAIKYCLENLI